ncbi:ribonuclease H2, subunit B [Earliella scabrosa]|nr:ribonuclease H2, subunit B [Earliella scabrosa]
MAAHVGVLPAELVQSLSSKLNGSGDDGLAESRGVRFMRMPHPRTGIPALFLPYELPEDGSSVILEVQAVCPPNKRSWFMRSEVLEDGKLLVMTPIDPAFLLIPLLQTTLPSEGHGNFRPLDDIFEDVLSNLTATVSKDAGQTISPEDLAQFTSLKCTQAAMRRVCDFNELTPEITVYRYSPERVQSYLKTKVGRLSHQDISEMSRTLTRNLAKDGLLDDGKEVLLTAARLRSACDLVSQYLPRDVYIELLSSYDFAALDAHMKVLKEEAMALAAVNMNAVEARESRDSKEDKDTGGDKKRKPKTSAGVEKLKKANIKGMAKLSTFFQKK